MQKNATEINLILSRILPHYFLNYSQFWAIFLIILFPRKRKTENLIFLILKKKFSPTVRNGPLQPAWKNQKMRRRLGPGISSPAWAAFGPDDGNAARFSSRVNANRSEGLGRETQLPPGPNLAQCAVNRSSAMDG